MWYEFANKKGHITSFRATMSEIGELTQQMEKNGYFRIYDRVEVINYLGYTEACEESAAIADENDRKAAIGAVEAQRDIALALREEGYVDRKGRLT